MIYLIDDNKFGQMADYYKTDFTSVLQLYRNHITWLENIFINKIEQIISNAKCILIHDSLEGKENKERLVALARKNKIPYCLFSNGFAATIFEYNSIKEINKDRMYNNLLTLIDHYCSIGKIDLKLLSLGQGYDLEKSSIIQDRLISGVLFYSRNNFNYEIAFPSGSPEYKDLMELFYLSEPTGDFSRFEDRYNKKETSAEIMRMVIIKMTKKVKQKYE
jgi:hypothetical protein